MPLSQNLREYISACFTGIWLQSHEHSDALREIAQLCRDEEWSLATWDIDKGLSVAGHNGGNSGEAGTAAIATDPVAAIRSVNALATPEGSVLLVLPNFHRFLQSTEIVQALAHQIHAGKNNRTFIVVLSPVVQIPTELEKLFTVIEHDLPDKQQLQKIAEGIATEANEMPQGEDLQRLLDAAAGLTRYEAEGAFSLSLVRHAKLQPETVWELKAGMLKKSGLLALHRGGDPHAIRNSQSLRQQITSQLSGVQAHLDQMLVDCPRRRILRGQPAPAVNNGEG